MSNKSIINLKNVSRKDVHLVGGKGAFLGDLIKQGVPVPPGFIVSTGIFREIVLNPELMLEIDTQISTLDTQDISNLERASENISNRIKDVTIPEYIIESIEESFDKLDCRYVAVRSSATVEDGKNYAWAGQLETYLGVPKDNLVESIKSCWMSLYSPKALYYRVENGFHSADIGVAVVVQRMVSSEVSGVCFSVHPITENTNHILIEACYGLGEKLVSGQIHPDSYVVDKETKLILSKQINNQSEATFCDESGCIAKDISLEEGIEQKLDDKRILCLADKVMKIESISRFPCDVEWCYANDKLYILQNRPITTLKKDVFEYSDNKYRMLRARKLKLVSCMWNYTSRTHPVTEELHGTRLPQAWTLFEPNGDLTSFVVENEWKLMEEHFKKLYIEDPLYLPKIYNTQLEQGRKLMSISEKIMEEPLGEYTINKLINRYRKIKDNWEKYNSFNSIPWLVGGDSLGKHLLEESMRFDMEPEEYRVMSMNPEKSFSLDEEYQVVKLCLDIVSGRQKSVFKKRNVDFIKLPGWIQDAIDQLVEKYYWVPFGYDGPNLYDREYYIAEICKYLEKSKKELTERYEELSRFEDDTKQLHSDIKTKYNLDGHYLRKIGYVHTLSRMSDERKEATNKSHIAMHRVFSVLAEKTNVSEDVFKYLSFEELKQNIDDSHRMLEIYSRRIDNPYILYYVNGTYEIIEDPEDVIALTEELRPDLGSVHSVQGLTVSSGNVDRLKGTAKVLRSHKEMSKVQEGDVLVATMTTPQYSPAMRRAAAIVTDEGGMTCHAAIISRELNIPCVIGTKIATKVFKDNEVIELDLKRSIVRRI
ncbi:hypothetical protein JXA34_03025 [Patescibacteria group bacterium]|nr:hypothetical protein [Patescibacteria group bacterium]